MKKLLTLALAILCISTSLFACNTPVKEPTLNAQLESATETMIVIKVTENPSDANAIDALTFLQNQKKLTFESFDGGYGEYVTSVNGKKEVANGNEGYSWMLYTSDEDFSSTEFGSVTYNDCVYGQSAVGASFLKVKEGEYYIWVYERWAF